jgi:hypothetical protein
MSPVLTLRTMTCRHCGRSIVSAGGTWIDPEATGDDSVWRETCDSNDTFEAQHEPTVPDDDDTPEFMHTILVPGDDWHFFAAMLDVAVKEQLYVFINGVKVELRSFDPYGSGILTAHRVSEDLDWLDEPDVTLKVVRVV